MVVLYSGNLRITISANSLPEILYIPFMMSISHDERTHLHPANRSLSHQNLTEEGDNWNAPFDKDKQMAKRVFAMLRLLATPYVDRSASDVVKMVRQDMEDLCLPSWTYSSLPHSAFSCIRDCDSYAEGICSWPQHALLDQGTKLAAQLKEDRARKDTEDFIRNTVRLHYINEVITIKIRLNQLDVDERKASMQSKLEARQFSNAITDACRRKAPGTAGTPINLLVTSKNSDLCKNGDPKNDCLVELNQVKKIMAQVRSKIDIAASRKQCTPEQKQDSLAHYLSMRASLAQLMVSINHWKHDKDQ